MASFVQLLKNAVKLVVVIGTFFLFGYLELQYRCGFVVTVLVGLYLFRSGSRVVPPLLVIGNIAASYFAIKPLVVLSFLALNCALFLTEPKPADDTKVVLRPYESEVRSIFFRNEPGLLNTVDALLNEHEGREKELIYKLTKQYEGGTPKKTPSKNVKTPSKAEPTPVKESALFQNQPSPREAMWGIRTSQQNTLSPQNTQNTQNTDTVSNTVSRIKNILRTRDPALFKSVDRMLQEYRGREEDLLLEVQQEYQVSEENEGGYEDRARQAPAVSAETSPLRQPDEWYPSHGSYRTLDGRPAARVSVERGFTSPYSQNEYSNNATPRDLHSVESVHAHAGERMAPFSPRVVSLPRSANYTTSDSYATNSTSAAYREELAQAPYSNNYTSTNTNPNNVYDDDTPRFRPTYNTSNNSTGAYTANTNHNSNINTQAYRSAIQQAQEDARREMQARIDARWGPKPGAASGGNGGSSGSSGSSGGVQQRRGYSYGEN